MEEKRKPRTFRQLEKEKSLQELNQFSRKVTEIYATSIKEYSQTNVANDNNLTVKCLRQLMDYAISTALVSTDIASKVLEKTMTNQQRNNKEAGSSSIMHHKKLIKQRIEFVSYSYPKVEVCKIAEDIANNPSKTIDHFTRKYGIESEKVTKKLLERSIIENIISDEMMEKIIERSNPDQTATQYFIYLRNQRNKNS